jgi:ATP-dependent Lon protease
MFDVKRSALYPVLPLRDIVVFPHMIVPLFVGREKSVRALEDVMKDDKQILLVTQKNAAQDDPTSNDIYRVGTVATVLQLLKLPDGTVKVLVEGGQRAKIARFSDKEAFFEAYAEPMEEEPGETQEIEALARAVVSQFEQYIKLNRKIPPEVLVSVNQIEDPSKLADTIASHLNLKIPDKQQLLEAYPIGPRLERVYGFMEGEIGVLQVEKRIRNRVKRQMEKTQREYYLNEQLKAIQKELGEGDRRTRGSHQEDQAVQGGPREGAGRGEEAAHHEPDVGGGDGGAQLPRLAVERAVEEADQGQARHQAGRGGARGRSLRTEEGQGADHRVPRGADPHPQGEGADPVPGRAARRG